MDRDPFKKNVVLQRAVLAGAAIALAAACTTGSEHAPKATSPEVASTTATAGSAPKAIGSIAARIIFSSNRSGSYELYEKNLLSDKLMALTHGPSDHMNPEVSPDGTQLIFYSNQTSDMSNQIFTLDLQHPESVTQLTHDAGGINDYDPVYMPDGDTILYKKSDGAGAYGDIWAMNKDGSDQHAVTKTLTAHRQEGWKPTPIDNDHALITIREQQGNPGSDDLYILDIRSGGMRQLTKNSWADWFSAANPRTHEVAFVSKSQGSDPDSIFTMQPDGTERTAIIRRSGDTDDPSWTPDGKHLLFISKDSADSRYAIYSANPDGSGVTLLDQSSSGDDLSPIALP